MKKETNQDSLVESMKAYGRTYTTFTCCSVMKTTDQKSVQITGIDLECNPFSIRVFTENATYDSLEAFCRESQQRIAELILANLEWERKMTTEKIKKIYVESDETMAYLLETYEGCRTLKKEEIQELLEWSGDDIVTPDEIIDGWRES